MGQKEWDPSHARRFAEGPATDPGRAIIAPRDHVYGMYRMFGLLTENASTLDELRLHESSPQVRVFRQHREAREWLLSAGNEVSPPALHS